MKRKRSKLYQSKSWLYDQYVRQGKTISEIQEAAGVKSPDTIQRYLEKYGLIRNGRSWAR